MKMSVCGLLLGALLILEVAAAGEKGSVEPPRSIVLTSEHPSGHFPIEPKTVAETPPILALSFTKVVNPEKKGIEVSAYLSYQARGELTRTRF